MTDVHEATTHEHDDAMRPGTRWASGLAVAAALALTASLAACGEEIESDANTSDDIEALQGLGFAFQYQRLDVSGYFTDDNLRFDPTDNPQGLFTSSDDDTGITSDAQARRELVALGESGRPSYVRYVDVGPRDGDVVILFHGLPTYSFLWRDVIPQLTHRSRVIAFDQLGQGFSTKHRELTYTYKQHLAHTEAFIEALDLDPTRKLTLVGHDTGGALAFAYAARHPERIKALSFFETIYGPIPSFDAMPPQAKYFRSPEGQADIVENNAFIRDLIERSSEVVEPNDRPFTVRELTRREKRAYKIPYLRKQNRRVLARWVADIPALDDPDSSSYGNLELFGQFAQYLTTTEVPKLFFHSDPGVISVPAVVDFVKSSFNAGDSLTSIDLGLGYHYLQEDYGVRIGQEIARWLRELDGEPEQPSAEFPYRSRYAQVLGSKMHYIDVGEGKPILLLHGNPTSSYLWRNIVPFLAPQGRVIALDLIGMGKSDKPDIGYTYAEHIQYVEGFIETMGLDDIALVIHDWGSALGLDYASRHPDNVRGIAFMEAVLPPMFPGSFDTLPPFIADFFTTMRDPVLGPELVLQQNLFIEEVLPSNIMRPLSDAEMNIYRRPYPTPATRKPLLVWPNQVPIDGTPEDVVAMVERYSAWLEQSQVPKLHVHVTPGVLNTADIIEYLSERLSNYQTAHVGEGLHFIQEDHPEVIGLAIADWLQRVVDRPAQ